jgi:SAM-dependent methyltransferase
MNLPPTDKANAEFWDELCGTAFAKELGIVDHTTTSLQKFDQAYLDFYPYLLDRVPVTAMRSMRVLEAGLGYGTLGQRIAEHAADYLGLDIAAGPVKMMSERLRMRGLRGKATQGSMLNCPVADASFDAVVSIGCFHHTGDTQRCLDETWRVLRPGGWAYLMVYNRFSLRQWKLWPRLTYRAWRAERIGARIEPATASQRIAYDPNSAGGAAPETDFFSIGQVRRMLSRFSTVQFWKENCDDMLFRGRKVIRRKHLLPIVGPLAGLDIYVAARK